MARKFRPKKWSTAFTLAALCVLLALGGWQVQRMHWKANLLERITARMAEKPVPLPENIGDADAWEYRRVTMAGRFLHDKSFLVGPRTLEGKNGHHMVTPFRRASGGVVLVNRGWISDELLKKAQRPSGIVQVEGIVQAPKKHYFTPENDPLKGAWYWIDTEAMAHAAGLKAVSPAIVTIAAKTPGVYPMGGQVRLDIPNDHQKYAAFWFGMAFLLGVIYFLFHLEDDDAGLPKA